MKNLFKTFMAGIAFVLVSGAYAGTTKDIVIDRVTPAQNTPSTPPGNDALAVSILLESPDGTLAPRPANAIFHTGDRFRVKLLASREARISLYNTNPQGELSSKPIWAGAVAPGQETISPRLRLDGTAGTDLLHIVMEPKKEAGMFDWLRRWLSSFSDQSSKAIELDVENSGSASYMLNRNGEGLVATVRISHD